MVLKYRKSIIFIVLTLNLIQIVLGNTFVLCRNDGFNSKTNLTLYHGHNENCSDEKKLDQDVQYDEHSQDNHCNPFEDLYIENSANTSNLRKYEFVPEVMIDYSFRFITFDLNNYSSQNSNIARNFLNTSFYFPATTILRL